MNEWNSQNQVDGQRLTQTLLSVKRYCPKTGKSNQNQESQPFSSEYTMGDFTDVWVYELQIEGRDVIFQSGEGGVTAGMASGVWWLCGMGWRGGGR